MNVPHLYDSGFTSGFISLYTGFTTDATYLKDLRLCVRYSFCLCMIGWMHKPEIATIRYRMKQNTDLYASTLTPILLLVHYLPSPSGILVPIVDVVDRVRIGIAIIS